MNRTVYLFFGIDPNKRQLELGVLSLLRDKFPQLDCSSAGLYGSDFFFSICHPCFPESLIKLTFDKIRDKFDEQKECLEIEQKRIMDDAFFMDWVEHEIIVLLNNRYVVQQKRNGFFPKSSWWPQSYRCFMDFIVNNDWMRNQTLLKQDVEEEINYRLKVTAKDMIHLFGWQHYTLNILNPSVGI